MARFYVARFRLPIQRFADQAARARRIALGRGHEGEHASRSGRPVFNPGGGALTVHDADRGQAELAGFEAAGDPSHGGRMAPPV